MPGRCGPGYAIATAEVLQDLIWGPANPMNYTCILIASASNEQVCFSQ